MNNVFTGNVLIWQTIGKARAIVGNRKCRHIPNISARLGSSLHGFPRYLETGGKAGKSCKFFQNFSAVEKSEFLIAYS